MRKLLALAMLLVTILAQDAFAYSREVRRACRADYYAHCNTHAVGSPELRTFMRKVGKRLSSGCIGALKASGEVAKENRRVKKTRRD